MVTLHSSGKNRGLSLFFLAWLTLPLAVAQTEYPEIVPDRGIVEWSQEILEMGTSLRLMCVAAHPDDEDSDTLAYYNRGLGVRTSILLANWGEGGQNEIGPELYEDLGVLRSRETLEAAELLGTQVYCLNQKDFGYSKSIEETWEFWDREQAMEDTVQVLRMERPHVVITNHRAGRGHGNHQAIAQLIQEAIPLAASSEAYLFQIDEGLAPWQVERLFQRRKHHEGEPTEDYDVEVPVGLFDPRRGMSFQEIAGESLLRHRTQGAQGVWNLVNQRRRSSPFTYFYLLEGNSPLGPFEDLFQGMEGAWWTREGWDPFTYEGLVNATPTNEDRRREALQEALDLLYPDLEDLEDSLFEALEAVKALPSEIDNKLKWVRFPVGSGEGGRADWTAADSAAYQSQVIERFQRLGREQVELENLIARVWGLDMEIDCSETELYPGQEAEVELILTNRGPEPVEVGAYTLNLPSNWESRATQLEIGRIDSMGTARADFWIRVATSETPTLPQTEEIYRSMRPWKPNLSANAQIAKGERTVYINSEERIEIAPAWEVWIEPGSLLLPVAKTEEVQFTIETERHESSPSPALLTVTMPGGEKKEAMLQAIPARRSSTRVPWNPEVRMATGTYILAATLDTPSGIYRGESRIARVDVQVAEGLRVGVVQSYDDTLPDALATLGVETALLSPTDLTQGDLAGFDTILIDIRAYAERNDLREANPRLLAYAQAGGHLVVSYHKSFEWNDREPPFAPFPLELSRERVTNEHAPVNLLLPEHPALNWPNRIGESDWKGWIHERGLYFPGTYDVRYQELVSMADPGESPLNGGILWAEVGEGSYVYTSLVLYRQLRANVPGAYRLFANLISFPKKGA